MNEEAPLSVFESVNVVSLRPGDVLLFRCPQSLRPEALAKAKTVLDEVFRDHEVMILDGGLDIAVLRPEPGFIRRMMGKLFGKPVPDNG